MLCISVSNSEFVLLLMLAVDVPWTAKQDIVQVFGLRKVYRMPPERKKCCWLGSPVQYRQQSLAGSQPKHHCKQQRRQFIAVADSWFGVAKGQLLCLLGPNGAGKTTTINCMTGGLQLYAERVTTAAVAV